MTKIESFRLRKEKDDKKETGQKNKKGVWILNAYTLNYLKKNRQFMKYSKLMLTNVGYEHEPCGETRPNSDST